MAGRGPSPKDPALRARRNKAATRVEIEIPEAVGGPTAAPPPAGAVPTLPVRPCGQCPKPPAKPEKGKAKKGRGKKKAAAPKPPPVCTTCEGRGFHPYHPETLAWWADVWSPTANPFCGRYLGVDVHPLRRLAQQVDIYNRTYDVEILKEIRLQEEKWGLNQMARRSLQWEVKRPPMGGAGGQGGPEQPTAPKPPRVDPRMGLFVVPALPAAGGKRA